MMMSLGSLGVIAARAYLLRELSNFDRWKDWDAQRLDKLRFHREFKDYASVAIGLYAAANGIPRWEILAIQDWRARSSIYDTGIEMDKTYTHLPIRNVVNTDLGYELYNSGRIAPTPPP